MNIREDIEAPEGTIRPAVFLHLGDRVTVFGHRLETKTPYVITGQWPFPVKNDEGIA
ncbi:hypothetical protein QMT40_001835 [Parvibaculaceae bacterium PLY_AMNH_Bact1]|nr:hypothetical protein QMT40_001835 [Parvibaculaceae bacterium PLY_AMNH_Bact1]